MYIIIMSSVSNSGGADFVPLSESVTFQPGDILMTVTVEILEDNIEEDIEFFTISAAYLLNTATGGVQNIEIQAQVLIESDAPRKSLVNLSIYTKSISFYCQHSTY